MEATIIPPPPPAGDLEGPPTVPLSEQPPAPPPGMPPAEPPPPKKSNRTLLIVVGVGLVLCCLLVVCGGLVFYISSSSTSQSAPFPTPAIESTVAPTDTELPEASTAPTEEEIPTSTTQLTTQSYAKTVSPLYGDFIDAMVDLYNLLKQGGKDSTLLVDSKWKDKVRADAGIVQSNYRKMAALNPPAALADIHSSLLDGARDCNDAMDHLLPFLDSLSPDELQKSIDLINSCSDKVQTFKDKLSAYESNP